MSLFTSRQAKVTLKNRGGFSSIEYACLIATLVAVLVGISAYITRSFCSKWREAGDSFGYGRQYEQGVTIEE